MEAGEAMRAASIASAMEESEALGSTDNAMDAATKLALKSFGPAAAAIQPGAGGHLENIGLRIVPAEDTSGVALQLNVSNARELSVLSRTARLKLTVSDRAHCDLVRHPHLNTKPRVEPFRPITIGSVVQRHTLRVPTKSFPLTLAPTLCRCAAQHRRQAAVSDVAFLHSCVVALSAHPPRSRPKSVTSKTRAGASPPYALLVFGSVQCPSSPVHLPKSSQDPELCRQRKRWRPRLPRLACTLCRCARKPETGP